MKYNVKAPSVGESITEVSILKWVKKNGQQVQTGDMLLEIESDKATVEVVAETSGALTILKQEGERVPIGEIIASIDDAVKGSAEAPAKSAAAAPAQAAHAPAAAQASASGMGPAARKVAAEQGVDVSRIAGTGKDGRVTKGDLLQANSSPAASATPARPAPAPVASLPTREGDRRVAMSNLRVRIAERLVQAQHTAAILTTFNEADMGPIMEVRSKHKDSFKAKHGVPLSFMSFFTRASVEALKIVPEVNASIDGRDMIYHDYQDIGIAVGTEKGLVVPIVRDAGSMDFVGIEKRIAELALKARDGSSRSPICQVEPSLFPMAEFTGP